MIRPTVKPSSSTFYLLVFGERGRILIRCLAEYTGEIGQEEYPIEVILSPSRIPRQRRHLAKGTMLQADMVSERRLVDFVSWWKGRWQDDYYHLDPRAELDFLVEGLPRARGAGVRVDVGPDFADIVSPDRLRVLLDVVAKGSGLLVHSDTLVGHDVVSQFALGEAKRLKRKWVALGGKVVKVDEAVDLGLLYDSAGQMAFVPWEDKGKLVGALQLIRDSRISDEYRPLLRKVLASDDEMKPAKTLKANLRNYQTEGMKWLVSILSAGNGGILADAMGTGKSVQTISAYTKMKESDPSYRAIFFAPKSLMGNWQNEFRKFAPSIRVLVWDGPNRSRFKSMIPQVDVVVCSYDTYKRDQHLLNQHPFHAAFFDEAHQLKNPDTANHKAAKSCLAPVRIAMTGTPVENRLSDLHSIFSICCPGLLPPAREFNERIVRPFRAGDPTALQIMTDQIKPHVLRRTKEQVLSELPPKTIIDQLCPMTDVQAGFYQEAMEAAREEKKAAMESGNKSELQAVYFRLISRLRQIATDPRLADPMGRYRADDSGKMLTLRGMMDEFDTDDTNKVLIFSQWVQCLELVKQELEDRKQKFSYLTGETKNRDQQVENFQSKDDIRYFLISLKAGGVGLNITKANTVIIMDPWWNPAIENQAIDRAHRFGQQRNVTAYRMISEGTLEQAIAEMKEIKQAISDGVLDNKEMPNQMEVASSLIG